MRAFLKSLWQSLSHDLLFWLLLLILAGFSVARPDAIGGYSALVDWPTIATLTGLLLLTKGVELSGFLHRLGTQLVARMQSQRALALLLVCATAALATILTNDVALFVIVPLTLTLRAAAGAGAAAAGPGAAARGAGTAGTADSADAEDADDAAGTADANRSTPVLPITRLIIVEALAANAGSALTPIGNPQNLYLWQQSQASFGAYVWAMLPLALLLMLPLLLLTMLVFSGHASLPKPKPKPASKSATASAGGKQAEQAPVIDRSLLLTCLALYPPFLILTDLHHAPAALAALLLIFLATRRSVLARIDWGLLLVFILMFIDLRLVGAAQPVRDLFAGAGLAQPMHLYLAGIAASQVISNVPATILLTQYSHDWRTLAYAVNTGGAGLAIGSLANIIALRMAGERRAWLVFHGYSIPFLLATGALVAAWLHWS